MVKTPRKHIPVPLQVDTHGHFSSLGAPKLCCSFVPKAPLSFSCDLPELRWWHGKCIISFVQKRDQIACSLDLEQSFQKADLGITIKKISQLAPFIAQGNSSASFLLSGSGTLSLCPSHPEAHRWLMLLDSSLLFFI